MDSERHQDQVTKQELMDEHPPMLNTHWRTVREDVSMVKTLNVISGLAQAGGGFARLGFGIAKKTTEIAFETAKVSTQFGLHIAKSAANYSGVDSSLIDLAEYLALLGISIGEAATHLSLHGTTILVKGLQQLFGDQELMQMAIAFTKLLSKVISETGAELGLYETWKYFTAYTALQRVTLEQWALDNMFPHVELINQESDQYSSDQEKVALIKYYAPFALGCYGQAGLSFLDGKYHLNLSIDTDVKRQFYSAYCNIPENDVVFMSSVDRHKHIFEVDYMPGCVISLDHSKNEVVLAFRGTLSIKDTLVDLTCETEKMEVDGQEYNVHGGFLHAATKLTSKSHRIWEEIKIQLDLYPGYNLVITGHSLGAAFASFLGVIWGDLETGQLHPQSGLPDRRVQVYAYSCPNIFELALSEKVDKIISTFTIGWDCLARLSLQNVLEIKDALLWLHEYNKADTSLVTDLLESSNGIPTTIFDSNENLFSDKHQLYLNTRKTISDLHFKPDIKLYCPGTTFWLAKQNEKDTYMFYKVIDKRYVFSELLMYKSSVEEHLPNFMAKLFTEI